MANKRSTAGSRNRDVFRSEVSSLLADLGELAGQESPRPAQRPAAAIETPGPAGPQPPPAPVEEVLPAPQPDAVRPPRAFVPPVAEEGPPAPPETGWAFPPAPPPIATGTPGSIELDDLPSSSPSYLPPLPPILPPVAGPTWAPTPPPPPTPPPGPQPPPVTPEWASPWEPVVQPVTSTAWPEPSSSPAAGAWSGAQGVMGPPARDVAEPETAIRHHPASLPEAWPAPVAPPNAEAEAGAIGPAPVAGSAVEPVPDPGTTGPDAAGAERVWPWEDKPPPAIAPVRAPRLPGWRLRPTSAPVPPPAPTTLPETPGWGSDVPADGPGGPPRTLDPAEGGTGQRFRMAPPAGPVPPPEPVAQPLGGATTDGWETSPARADQGPSPAAEASWGGPEVPASARPLALPPDSDVGLPPPGPPVAGVTDIERIREALTPATPARTGIGAPPPGQRAGLPLLPGGTVATVSTRPWSIGAAMQPLKTVTPAPSRAGGGGPVAEPVRVAPSKRSGGINLPFPVVVAVLIAVLAVIVVLILLDVRR